MNEPLSTTDPLWDCIESLLLSYCVSLRYDIAKVQSPPTRIASKSSKIVRSTSTKIKKMYTKPTINSLSASVVASEAEWAKKLSTSVRRFFALKSTVAWYSPCYRPRSGFRSESTMIQTWWRSPRASPSVLFADSRQSHVSASALPHVPCSERFSLPMLLWLPIKKLLRQETIRNQPYIGTYQWLIGRVIIL